MTKPQPVSIHTLNQLSRVNEVRFSGDGRFLLYSTSEGSQGILYARKKTGKSFRISADRNVRGGIGYGGGDFGVHGDQAFFVDRNGSLYKTSLLRHAHPERISPAWGSSSSPVVSPNGQWILYVFQDGERDGLAVTRTTGIGWPSQLVMGANFYMQPCWHPSGEQIAWVEWDHPHMPWEASRVKWGEVGGMQVKLFEEGWVAGGVGRSASQPYFSPDGKWLSYIVRDGDWDNLVLFNLKRRTHKVLVRGAGFHLRLPEWVQGMRSYAWLHHSQGIVYTRYARGQASLWRLDISKGKSTPIDTGEIQWITQLDSSPINEDLVFLGSSPRTSKTICLLNNGQLSINQSKLEKEIGHTMNQPDEIPFQTAGGQNSFAFLYQPQDHDQQKKPLVIHIHGGPTSANSLSFSSDAAWFTSRGYAYAQLNYRGSSGYGYSYQDALHHQWGIVDVEDTYFLAMHLIDQGIADPKKIVVMGSSAGGYTVLRALINYPGFFKAGICSYGVSDLLADALNTHKFERFYHQFLTGDLSRNRKRFIERSPIHHIEQIKDPVALFHGDNDKVVAVDQTLEIYEKLKSGQTPCTLKIYEGEGHGFKEPENVADYYNRIESFLKKYLL
ncbi:MAG: S9 family peptidase [Chloroflexi bacterium]|nr:S9 family peptidase [Chloroflexota bacterium]